MSERIPGDVILEPNETVLVASRPLFLWEPLVILLVLLVIAAAALAQQQQVALAGAAAVAAALLVVWLLVRWIPWRARWFILTDRRVIARRGVLNRTQAALLLDRMQDATLLRPFPLSLVRDYGVIHVETAGQLSDESISGGLRDLHMTRATEFYRTLTDAMTPGR